MFIEGEGTSDLRSEILNFVMLCGYAFVRVPPEILLVPGAAGRGAVIYQ
jgi:hypothetical protein